jgi:ribosomal protein S18 acetylase RimI-like enzyme
LKIGGISEGEQMIRKIKREDYSIYKEMATDFYHSDAVIAPVDASHFEAAFREMVRSDVYLDGYIFESDFGEVAGYAVLSKMYSQESGGMMLWIDELYLRPDFRGMGMGTEFFKYVDSNLSNGVKRLRLEAEPDNEKALSLYKRRGFKILPYTQLIKEV